MFFTVVYIHFGGRLQITRTSSLISLWRAEKAQVVGHLVVPRYWLSGMEMRSSMVTFRYPNFTHHRVFDVSKWIIWINAWQKCLDKSFLFSGKKCTKRFLVVWRYFCINPETWFEISSKLDCGSLMEYNVHSFATVCKAPKFRFSIKQIRFQWTHTEKHCVTLRGLFVDLGHV